MSNNSEYSGSTPLSKFKSFCYLLTPLLGRSVSDEIKDARVCVILCACVGCCLVNFSCVSLLLFPRRFTQKQKLTFKPSFLLCKSRISLRKLLLSCSTKCHLALLKLHYFPCQRQLRTMPTDSPFAYVLPISKKLSNHTL